jgi:hypothetical protein
MLTLADIKTDENLSVFRMGYFRILKSVKK